MTTGMIPHASRELTRNGSKKQETFAESEKPQEVKAILIESSQSFATEIPSPPGNPATPPTPWIAMSLLC